MLRDKLYQHVYGSSQVPRGSFSNLAATLKVILAARQIIVFCSKPDTPTASKIKNQRQTSSHLGNSNVTWVSCLSDILIHRNEEY